MNITDWIELNEYIWIKLNGYRAIKLNKCRHCKWNGFKKYAINITIRLNKLKTIT